MCGIFGFIGKNGIGPDLASLRRIAAETETRGRHAFGLAWLSPQGTVHTFKRPGPATADLGDLGRCQGGRIVLGHCRWATHGDPQDNGNNHPHRAGRGWFVHNGVVHNYQDLLRRYGFRPASRCDSEIFGLLIARAGGPLLKRAAWAARQTHGTLALLGLWNDPPRLLIIRRGRPLALSETNDGFYFASLPKGLPGHRFAMRDNFAALVTLSEHGLELERLALEG